MRAVAGRSLRILDFDIENRPLSYWIPDRPTAEITAIAWQWVGSPETLDVTLLTRTKDRVDLELFVANYNAADLVTGHYIRRHDLPIINGALVEAGLAPLKPKMTSDTKIDLIGWKDIPKTQEHLAHMLGLDHPKVGMSQSKWRDANRLTPSGVIATTERVKGDVVQHIELREELLKRGLLGPPRVWRP